MMCSSDNRQVKWGYATHVLSDTGAIPEIRSRGLLELGVPPQRDDVIVAEVTQIGQHTRMELHAARLATLFRGDLVGVAYGHRYATRQYEGAIPDHCGTCHLLSVAGVCGMVLGKSSVMREPTVLQPLGYPIDEDGNRLNLRRYGIAPVNRPLKQPTAVLVVGSSMDSGKTTVASSVINGLSRAGARVCAGKLTGTGSAKDTLLMLDAGALKILDFTDVGHASTAQCTYQELSHIAAAIRSHLSIVEPDYIVLEIADGLVQRETAMLLRLFQVQQCIDYTFYCCNDSLGVESGLEVLRGYNLNVVAVSGLVAYSPLAVKEAKEQTKLPVLLAEELRDASVAALLPILAREYVPLSEVG